MAFTQQDIQSLHEMLDTYANRIRTDIRSDVNADMQTALLGFERRLRDEITQSNHSIRLEFKKAIHKAVKEANEKQTQLLVEMIGSLADNLDDAYAEKQTEVRIEKIAEHLRQTP